MEILKIVDSRIVNVRQQISSIKRLTPTKNQPQKKTMETGFLTQYW